MTALALPFAGCGGGSDAADGRAGAISPSADLFAVRWELSPTIPTVGIVTWSIAARVTSAHIDFGRDQRAFEYHAPVDLAEDAYRTLLLGMKPDTTYYARITAEGPGGPYLSAVYSLTTGFLPNGLPSITVTDHDASRLFARGGFTINCTGVDAGGGSGSDRGAAGDSWAFVFDADGDEVWAYALTGTPVASCSRARMSLDGKFLWAGNFNGTGTMGALMRVSMDGLGAEKTFSIPARHHDFAFLPNGHLLYFEQQHGGGDTNGKEGPDTLRELDPETEAVTDIYDETHDFAETIADAQGAHTNQANYVPELGAISFSMRHTSTIGLVGYPDAALLAVFGGPTSQFREMDWQIQHGHDVRADRLWVFNNNGTNGGSDVLGFDFDLAANTSENVLTYTSGRSSGAFGDVKELPNGNLYVTYSTDGVLQEITASGELLRELRTSASLGYSEHRATLYGPPPPFDR